MTQRVGMSRRIKLGWLNKTAELVEQGQDEETIRAELKEYLSYEIDSAEVLKNTRTILLQTWVYISEDLLSFRGEALHLVREGGTDAMVAHWCMMLIAYPIFSDICGLIGKLTNIQDTFTTSWLNNRLFELWGERSTLVQASSSILLTLKNLGVIENQKIGVYHTRDFRIKNPESIALLMKTVFLLKKKAYYEITELASVPQLFPFRFTVPYELLVQSDQLSLNNIGGKVVLTAD